MDIERGIVVDSGFIVGLLLGLLVIFVSCKENEEPLQILVSHISIKGDFIEDGETSQLTAVILPANASNQMVEWKVSNESVATISENGLLTAVSNGVVTVTASAKDGSGVTTQKSFNVSGIMAPVVLVEHISITGNNITDGRSQAFSAEILPINANNQTVVWSVSDETLANISASGVLTPIKNGSVTVRASATDASGIVGEKTVSISGVLEGTDGTIVGTAEDILNAIVNANPGDKIYIRGGTYTFSTKINLSRDGAEGNLISLIAHPQDTERPKFDFSSMAENSGNRGLQLSGDYWYVKGIDVFGAGDNGMFISGNYNLVEFCTFSENTDTGLQIGNGASHNTVLNCDSFYNADSSIENADGFACKLDAGDGNKFIGCRAWQNLDDGWDGYLRGADNITTTYVNCWAFKNGMLKDGTIGGGDGNGFKTGGSDDKLLKHNALYTNCIAAGNIVDGFDHNSNRGTVIMYNCSAHSNGRNINFGSSNIASSLTIKNSLSFAGGSGDSYQATATDITNNSWQDGLEASAIDFVSIDLDALSAPRKADGSLPDVQYLHLQSDSDLIDKGVDVGLDYSGSAPDLGAFEHK